jgi:hypothetical protein
MYMSLTTIASTEPNANAFYRYVGGYSSTNGRFGRADRFWSFCS